MIGRAAGLRAESWNLSDLAEVEVVKGKEKRGLHKSQFRDRTQGGSSQCLGRQEKRPNAPIINTYEAHPPHSD